MTSVKLLITQASDNLKRHTRQKENVQNFTSVHSPLTEGKGIGVMKCWTNAVGVMMGDWYVHKQEHSAQDPM